MGTSCITVLKEDDEEIAVLYRQFDGYPEKHGAEILDCLGKRQCVNGFNDSRNQINGSGDMCVLLIAGLKSKGNGVQDCGQFYLHAPQTRNYGEAYIYTLTYLKECQRIHLHVEMHDDIVLYDGPLGDYQPVSPEEEETE